MVPRQQLLKQLSRKWFIAAPMTIPEWGKREYFWGRYDRNLCNTPVDSNDPDFVNVFTTNFSRPTEIGWNCYLGEQQA